LTPVSDSYEITEYKDFLESIISSAADIIYLLDNSGNITFINDAIKFYGWQPEELIGKSIMEIVHPEDKQKAMFKINERRTGQRASKVFEVRLLTKGNNIVPLEAKISEFNHNKTFRINAEGIYKNGKVLEKNFYGTHGIARDISMRKKMDKLLQDAYSNLENEIDLKNIELVDSNSKLIKENSKRRQIEKELEKYRKRVKFLEKKCKEIKKTVGN
jgi:PAS domain S-box-containing protein